MDGISQRRGATPALDHDALAHALAASHLLRILQLGGTWTWTTGQTLRLAAMPKMTLLTASTTCTCAVTRTVSYPGVSASVSALGFGTVLRQKALYTLDSACMSLRTLIAQRRHGGKAVAFMCTTPQACAGLAWERDCVWGSQQHVRTLVQLRALVLAGRARPKAAAGGRSCHAWLTASAPLWVLVSVVELWVDKTNMPERIVR